jgi:hypothetical protein
MHPQTVFTLRWFCVEELVGQLLCIVAIIASFEVNYEAILLRTHCCNGERALSSGIKNREGGTDGVARRNIRSERNEKVSTDAMRLSDSANFKKAFRRCVCAQK